MSQPSLSTNQTSTHPSSNNILTLTHQLERERERGGQVGTKKGELEIKEGQKEERI
jgi:hypothetical protein